MGPFLACVVFGDVNGAGFKAVIGCGATGEVFIGEINEAVSQFMERDFIGRRIPGSEGREIPARAAVFGTVDRHKADFGGKICSRKPVCQCRICSVFIHGKQAVGYAIKEIGGIERGVAGDAIGVSESGVLEHVVEKGVYV